MKIYFDKDADIKYLKGKTVGVIGYGIQGRAQSLNLRDSGVNVMVANRRDKHAGQATKDGFKVHGFTETVKRSDIILFLIPDQAQRFIYNNHIKDFIRPKCLLSFAHGCTLRYKTINVRRDIDIAMLAPRMPGYQIRDYYRRKGGVTAFMDVVQDVSGLAGKKILAVAKAAGFTRGGVIRVSYRDEAELDLFTEQFLVAQIVNSIYTAFKILNKEFGYPAEAVLMELYASGELAEVLKMASKMGIGTVFQKNASPTCQYGIAANFDSDLNGSLAREARRIAAGIRNGSFSKMLAREGEKGYPTVRWLWKIVNDKRLVAAQRWINKAIKD